MGGPVFGCGAGDGRMLNSLRAPIDVCLGMHSVCPRSMLVRDSSFRTKRGSVSCVTLYPLTDMNIGGSLIAAACPSGAHRRGPLARAFAMRGTVGDFVGYFRMSKRRGRMYKLCNCAAFGTIGCFRRVPVGRDRSRVGSTPSVLCVLCGCVVVFGRFGGRLALMRVLDRKRRDKLPRLRSAVRGHGCTSCGFSIANPMADPVASRRRGTGIHGNVTRYLHNSIFRVILSEEFMRPCTNSSFGMCHTLHDVGPSPCLFCFSFNNCHVFNSSPRARYGVRNGRTYVSPVTKAAHHANSSVGSGRLTRTLLTSPGRGTRRIVLMSLTQGSLDHGYRSIHMIFCGRPRCCDRIVRLIDHIDKMLGRRDDSVGAFVSAFPTNALDNTPGMHTVRLVDRVRPRGHNTCNNYVKFVKLGKSLGRTVAVHAFIDHGGRL